MITYDIVARSYTIRQESVTDLNVLFSDLVRLASIFVNVNYIVSLVTVAYQIQDTRIDLYRYAIKKVIVGQDDIVTYIEYVNIKSFFDNEGIRVIELKVCSESSFDSTYFCDSLVVASQKSLYSLSDISAK
jgi:hypothetical protein